MWIYHQTDGTLFKNETFKGSGYSGKGRGRNCSAMQNVPNVGPIPQGNYLIGSAYDDIGRLGPCVMHLDPMEGTNTFGRTAFRIHGDNSAHDASHGCVILGPNLRHMIAESDDRILQVLP